MVSLCIIFGLIIFGLIMSGLIMACYQLWYHEDLTNRAGVACHDVKILASSFMSPKFRKFHKIMAELRKTKASLKQRHVVRTHLKQVWSKLAAVRAELRKSKASVRQLAAVRKQLKQVWDSSKTKASQVEFLKARAQLMKSKASVRQLRQLVAVHNQLRKVHALSNTKASRSELKSMPSVLALADKASLESKLEQLQAVLDAIQSVLADKESMEGKLKQLQNDVAHLNARQQPNPQSVMLTTPIARLRHRSLLTSPAEDAIKGGA